MEAMKYKHEVECIGYTIVRDLMWNPKLHSPYICSNNGRKWLYIYNDETNEPVWNISAPTWYDLYQAARSAMSLRLVTRN